MTGLAAPDGDRLRLPPHVRDFTRAIEAWPDVPVNYLLRGEEWLAVGRFGDARADFEAARALAEQAALTSAWGFVFQAYVDRADAGLRQCGSALD